MYCNIFTRIKEMCYLIFKGISLLIALLFFKQSARGISIKKIVDLMLIDL